MITDIESKYTTLDKTNNLETVCHALFDKYDAFHEKHFNHFEQIDD